MKRRVYATMGAAVLVVAAAFTGLALSNNPADAQQQGVYEYAYLVAVPRIESYEIDLSRWAGSDEDKEYIKTHVFVYEEGQSSFDRHRNSLQKINELAGEGWELVDAQVGVMRRKK